MSDIKRIFVSPEIKEHLCSWIENPCAEIGQPEFPVYDAALAPDPWYSCGAAYCDDPACTTHNVNHPNHDD